MSEIRALRTLTDCIEPLTPGAIGEIKRYKLVPENPGDLFQWDGGIEFNGPLTTTDTAIADAACLGFIDFKIGQRLVLDADSDPCNGTRQAYVQVQENPGRYKITMGFGEDVFDFGAIGPNVAVYGNEDNQHGSGNGEASAPIGAPIVFLTGADNDVNAAMFVTGGNSGPGEQGRSIYINGAGGGWDRVDGQAGELPMHGALIIDNPQNVPGIVIEGANATEGELAVPAGDFMRLGDWDHATQTFTSRMLLDTFGNIENTGGIYCNDLGDLDSSTLDGAEGFNYVRGSLGSFARNGGTCLVLNRMSNGGASNEDGPILAFHQSGVKVADVTVNAGVAAYNTFVGGHFSQLENMEDELPIGTIVCSVNKLCDFGRDGEHLPMCEPASAGATAVYGVAVGKANAFQSDELITHQMVEDGKGNLRRVRLKNPVKKQLKPNALQLYSLGAFQVRLKKGTKAQPGDIVVASDVAGCGAIDNDAPFAKIVAKVTANVELHKHEDGSFTVPATLHCG